MESGLRRNFLISALFPLVSRRFRFTEAGNRVFFLGLSSINAVSNNSNLILLPLSALTTGQTATSIFIYDNGIAKKSTVEVAEVIGEYAKIKTDLSPDTIIIVDGNKMLQEGQSIKLAQ